MRGGAPCPLSEARRTETRLDFRAAPRRLHCVDSSSSTLFRLLHGPAPLLLQENQLLTALFPSGAGYSQLRETMSASAAKVSKKELNSNHDGADETSGKQGLPFTAIFTLR